MLTNSESHFLFLFNANITYSPAGQPGGWGQNIAAGAQIVNVSAVITGQFYNGEEPMYPGYGESSPDMSLFQKWGHFSQVVWGNTESVGCYSYTCNPTNDCQANGQPYLANTPCGPGGVPAINHVCNYYPPGKNSEHSDAQVFLKK